MSGFAGYLTASLLELQILSINFLGLVCSTLNWSWLKWHEQQEKIWNLSISQSNKLDVKNIDLLKTILLWIVKARFYINRVSFIAYVANIYTILKQGWQNLLIIWMVFSFLQDIVLEIIIIIIAFLLWYKGNVSTPLLFEFVIEKTIWLIISTYKWCTILKWYMQLRRAAKIHKFTIIVKRSIANIIHVSEKVEHSLNDESLDTAIIRRGKYTSLLNLDELLENSSSRLNFDLRISKSLTTLITNDSQDSNDTNYYDSIVNDLSVAEKSMKMLSITAEDVMDARARIQERSYWNEQDVITKKFDAVEKIVTQFSLENNKEQIHNAMKNKQTTIDDMKEIMDPILKKKEIIGYPLIQKEREKDNSKTALVDNKQQIMIRKQKETVDVSLVKNEDIEYNEVKDHIKSTESIDAAIKEKKKEESKKVAKIVQYPSNENATDMDKSCFSLARKLETKLCSIPVSQEELIDQIDYRKHSNQAKTKLIPADLNANKKEHYKNSRTSCDCYFSQKNNNTSKNEKYMRSVDINDKNVKHDIDKKGFKHFASTVNTRTQKSKVNECSSSLNYLEIYRLKKQIQKSEEFSTKQSVTWGSMSLAQTARPSGYAKNIVAANKTLYQKNVQTESFNESNNSLIVRHKLKHLQNRRSANLHSIYNMAPFNKKNYVESKEHETRELKALITSNNLTLLENKTEMKARERLDLPLNRKLSIKEYEAMELRALRVHNKLTLLEDKKELEERRKRVLSLNYEQPTNESEVSEINVLEVYDGLTLFENKKEVETIRRHNLSSSCKQLVKELSVLKACNELTLSEDTKESQSKRKHGSSKHKTSSKYEKNVETSTCVSNHLLEADHEETMISSETRRDTNNNSNLNNCHARRKLMSLNLKEITKNIEWIVHPRGIIIINKNLHSQFSENGRFRESQQRDIVDDNTTSMLHSAFFFKPEIITRIFRYAETKFDDSFPNFPTFLREDFNTEFMCRVNNEIVLQKPDSMFDFGLERMMGGQNSFGNLRFSNVNDNHVAREEDNHLCTTSIELEQIVTVSETAITEDSVIESQEVTRSSSENIDENHEQVDSATNVNLPVQSIIDILINFGFEVSEGNIHNVKSNVKLSAEQLEEYRNINDVIVDNGFQPQSFSANDEKDNNEYNRISLDQSADIDDIIDDQKKQILNLNNNCLDNVDVVLSLNSLVHDNLYNSQDENYLSATNIHSESNLSLKSIDINTTSRLSDNNNNNSNNRQFGMLINKTENSMFNLTLKNSLKLSFPNPSSFIESDNYHASILRSNDEELLKLTQLSDNEATLENLTNKSVLKSKNANDEVISQFRNNEILNLTNSIQDVESEGKVTNIYENVNEFSTDRFFSMNSDEKLQRDDSFYSVYERKNSSPETVVSFEDDSLMEEFSNTDTVLLETPADVFATNSAHSQ